MSAKGKKKNTGRTVLSVLLALVLIGAGSVAALYFGIKNYDNAYKPDSNEIIEFDIESGSGTTRISNQLEEAGIIRSGKVFKFKTKFCNLDGKYQAGHYSLSPSMTMEQIMEILQLGKLPEMAITIPEALTLTEVAEKLYNDGAIKSVDDFITALEDDYNYDFLPKTGYAVGKLSAKANRLEGYLYPETYKVNVNASCHEIINTMLSYFKSHVYDALSTSVPSGYTMHDMITLASMIEEECGAEKDRKTISGVFWNRLNIGMPLQSDVTIWYVLGKDAQYNNKIDSPYNTYKVNALPAGPICSPSYASIDAAMHPEYHNYYYFVLKGNGTGECFFAETYEEHLKNVEIYNNSDLDY